jgi:hypothetical protein
VKQPSKGQVWRNKRTGKEVKIREVQNGFVFHEPHGWRGGTSRHEVGRFPVEYTHRSG